MFRVSELYSRMSLFTAQITVIKLRAIMGLHCVDHDDVKYRYIFFLNKIANQK